MCEDMYKIVKEEVERVDCDSGGFNAGGLWKLKSKLRPKFNDYPTAMMDNEGNIVTSEEAIKKVTVDHFKKVLENRPMKDGLKKYQAEREELCYLRVSESRKNKTPKWDIEDVKYVIKHLKKKKSRDSYGFSNELFQMGGSDLFEAVLNCMNNIKDQQIFPKCLQDCNVTCLYKSKGSRKDLNNYRGIFRVNILRSILDRLIFNDEYDNIDQNLTDSNVGGRKGRNIRDNIFVLNAVINSIKAGKEEACDITLYDVEKCFDALWAQECINTLYECGLNNDKLGILYEETKHANIAIKTAMGITERVDIENLIMQGTVFGSIICTSVIDKLAKIFYQDKNLLYKYKGVVEVPILGMVDDVLNVAKCSEQTVMSNSTVNVFMEQNKLKLAASKCSRIHIGKSRDECHVVKVHDEKMKNSESEKYLGDFISHDGKHDATMSNRIQRAYSYLSEIRALLTDMPFGKRRLQIGLMLRDAMFVNGVLFNSEAWSSINHKHIEEIETIDRTLMRFLVGAHAKTPSEILYLETATIPLRYTMSIRRLMYHQSILSRSEDELIKKVYEEQKLNPLRGDWIEKLKEDFLFIGEEFDEENAKKCTKTEYKKYIKEKVRQNVFQKLKETQGTHIKVSEICYNSFKMQDYMNSHILTNHEVTLLFSLRSRTVRSVKNNFGLKLNCSMGCQVTENQEHWLVCDQTKANQNTHIIYSDIYGSIQQQIEVVKLFSRLEEEREELPDRGAPC